MISEFITGLGVFKTLLDTAKGLKDITNSTVRKSTAIDLQEGILAAREQYDAVVEKAKELQQQLARFETWDKEKQRYELRAIGRGAFAYVMKRECADGQPPHAICPVCYERRTKSILQSNGEVRWTDHAWNCPTCRATIKTKHATLQAEPDQVVVQAEPAEVVKMQANATA